MFYTIYKITNNINGKYYIGQHKTNNLNDGYMGSGVALKKAKQKYSIENFTKEYLYIFDNEDDMENKEIEIVTDEFCKMDETYNLCMGGNSGVNKSGLNNSNKDMNLIAKKISLSNLGRNKGVPNPNSRNRMLKMHLDGKCKYDNMKGKFHSLSTKEKMSNSATIKNASRGSKWFTNGREDVKIYPNQEIPRGYYPGRAVIPSLNKELKVCADCKQKQEDLYWWNEYIKSGMSVSQFCRDVYPFIRQNFYGLKKRMGK